MQQHSKFEYSEQSPREMREATSDPRGPSEQTEQQDLTSQASYFAPQQAGGQKIYPVRRRRRWLWILVIIVLLLALLGSLASLSKTLFSSTTILPQHTFQVSTDPQLVINDSAGTVTIHTGSNNTVRVNATEHTGPFTNLNAIQYTVEQTGNTIEVDVKTPNTSELNLASVDLDITLPAISDIQATEEAGSVNINGVSGLMNIQTDAGSIDFQNGTIKGNSNFQSNAGLIIFNGSLAPNGNYEFNTNAGSINITLPADSTFILDASANVGSVNNDFGSNTVGSNPSSQLHAHTGAGRVDINQR